MVSKGRCVARQASGERNSAAKLTAAQVLAIYRDTRPNNAIAGEYGVHESHVSRIKLGHKWRETTGHATPEHGAKHGVE
jgi:hypothetical protein